MTDLPKFEGRPLIKVPETIPTANFLQGEFGEAVNNAVVEKYGSFDPIKRISGFSDGVVKGSNPFYAVAVQEVIAPQGLRVATPVDLEKVLKIGALELRGQYEDSALVLRSEDSPNAYLAKDLAKQIRANQDLKFPIMIPLNGLALREDSKSDYGLAFDLKDGADVIYSKILNKNTNQFSSENIDEKTGLPTKLGGEDRTFYTRDSGLSRFYLYRGLDLDSYGSLLAYSDSCGRVVVVNSGAAQDFLAEIEQEYQTQRAKLEIRKEKAIAVLKGK